MSMSGLLESVDDGDIFTNFARLHKFVLNVIEISLFLCQRSFTILDIF